LDNQTLKRSNKPKNSNHKLLKILLGVFCILIIGAGICVYAIYGIITDDDTSSLFEESSPIIVSNDEKPIATDAAQPAAQTDSAGKEPAVVLQNSITHNGITYVKNENVVNILFLGIDTNSDRKVNMMGYRSDMVMVCAVDVELKTATLISIPRDTRTTVLKVDEDTGVVTETLDWKINTAYSYGGGAKKYSYPNAMVCVQMFLERNITLDTPLDFSLDVPVYLYAGIDMDGIPHVASSVGGVPITLEKSIPGVGSTGQTVNLKYDNSVLYLTNRHETGGDLDRARRQQKFMLSLATKIKGMDAPQIIISLYDDLNRYVNTNLNADQMLDLAKILMQVDIDTINLITIPGEGKKIDGTYFILHDEEATLQILLDVYYTKTN
jgi:polyisoprenyl-teichoic acid--peptidoglycan teichoic acid transferase